IDRLAVQAPEPDKRMAERGGGSGPEVDVIDLLPTGFFCGRRRDVAARNSCERHHSDDEAAIGRFGQHGGSPPVCTALYGRLETTSPLSAIRSQYLAVTGYFPGYLPGSLPTGALPTATGGGGSLRGKSAADATLAKANVAATTASTSFVMTKLLSC